MKLTVEKIKEHAENGLFMAECAKKLGTTVSQIRKFLAIKGMKYSDFKTVKKTIREKTSDGPGRPSAIFDYNQVKDAVSKGATQKEIAAHYNCSVDTVIRWIRNNTEFANFTDFKHYCYKSGNIDIRSIVYAHAVTDPTTARWLACLRMPDEFQMKPEPKREKLPSIRIIDGVADRDYVIQLQLYEKQFPEEQGGAILLDLAKLLPHQREFLTSDKRITILIAGFGAGKTFTLIRKCLVQASNCKGANGRSKGLIVYPTYDLAKELFLDPMEEMLQTLGIKYKINRSHWMMYIPGMGTIKIHSMQKGDRIVGSEYTYALVDEVDIEKEDVAWRTHNKILGRLRGMAEAPIGYVTTPEGFKFAYSIAVKKPAEDPKFAPLVKVVRAKSTDNPYLDKSYIQLLRDAYDPKMLEQYLNGEFVNLRGLNAFYGFQRKYNSIPYDKEIPKIIHVSMDFNINPMSAELADIQGYYDSSGKYIIEKYHIFDEITLYKSNTEKFCKYFKDRFPKHLDPAYPDYRAIVDPDPSGGNNHTDSNMTDIDILEDYGFEVEFIRAGIPIRDSLITTNKLLTNGILLIDPKCIELIADMEYLTTDNAGIIIDDNKERKHWSDGVRYKVYRLAHIETRGKWSA